MKRLWLLPLLLVVLMVTGCPDLENIDLQNPSLHISIQGEGNVSPKGGTYARNTLVQIQVTPEEGWTFSHWLCTHGKDIEPVQKEAGTWQILMNESKHLTAIFVPLQFNLSINITGQGSVHHGIMVTPQNHDYGAGQTISLIGLPQEGWSFNRWEGDLESTDNPATLVMDGDKEIEAIFIHGEQEVGTGILEGVARFANQEEHNGIRVVAQGEGVRKETFTDTEGNFSFSHLPTKNLFVEASYEGYYPTGGTVQAISGETVTIEEILYLYSLAAYGSAEGNAFFIDRDNHTGIAVNVRTLEGEELPNLIALTDDEGYFYFQHIPVNEETEEATYIFTAYALNDQLGYGTDSVTALVQANEVTTFEDDLWLRPAADEVIIFADDPTPWNSNALYDMLNLLEVDYSIHGSDEMATLDLPINKTVWIINDQYQSFYDTYAANQERFDNFVYQGGTLLFEACDQGWNNGSIIGASATLPGGVTNQLLYNNYNYNVNPTHPMMTAVPIELYGTHASHNYFVDLPGISTILCEDTNGNPTLVEYKYGQGRVVATGQPLEFHWNNAQNPRQIYANMIFYTFNQPIQILFPETEGLDREERVELSTH